MSKVYSTYEAKAKFSEILRQVRGGKTITISYHGEPVAEIRPIEKKQTLEERLEELERRGVITPATGPRKPFRPVAHVPGALQRFLDSRD
jgi:prevent-host-death family protein